jgi:hypothetical protein
MPQDKSKVFLRLFHLTSSIGEWVNYFYPYFYLIGRLKRKKGTGDFLLQKSGLSPFNPLFLICRLEDWTTNR